MRPLSPALLSRYALAALVLCGWTPGFAQISSIDLTVNDIGLSVGDSPRTIGLRLNYLDRQMVEVKGINATIWGSERVGDVGGLALGLPVTAARTITGVGASVVGVRAADSLRGIMIGGAWLEAGRGRRPGDLDVPRGGIDGVAIAPAMIVRDGRLRGIAVGGAIVNRPTNGSARELTGIQGLTVAAGWADTDGPLKGLTVAGIYADGESAKWVSLAGLALTARGDVDGISTGGVAVAGGHIRGLTIASGVVHSKSDIAGVSITGGLLSARSDIRGINIAAIAAAREAINGVTATGLSISARQIRGVAITGVTTAARDEITGISGAGFTLSGDRIRGLSVGGFRLSGGDITGIALGAGFLNGSRSLTGFGAAPIVIADRMTGIGLGGLIGGQDLAGGFIAPVGLSVSREGTLRGVSVGSFNAIHGTQRGLTIGIVNSARELHGVQIGLVNFAANNERGRRVLPLVNWHRD